MPNDKLDDEAEAVTTALLYHGWRGERMQRMVERLWLTSPRNPSNIVGKFIAKGSMKPFAKVDKAKE